MEEFEKEFGDAPEASTSAKPKKAKKAVEESDDEADGEDGEGDFDEVEEVDEEELGENPFANSGGGGRGVVDEPWLDSDRDYTYDEVSGTIGV
jgi:translation initiation factor 2 subunit 2